MFLPVIGAVQLALQEKGYFLLLYSNPDMEECVRISREWNVDGIILLGAKREGYYKIKASLSVPVVSIDTPFSAEDKDYVNVGLKDYEAADDEVSSFHGAPKITLFLLTEGGELLEKHYIDSERYRGYKRRDGRGRGLSGRSLAQSVVYGRMEKKQYLSFYEEKFFHATALFVTADTSW